MACRCASGEKPWPCSSVDSRTYAAARAAGGVVSAIGVPFRLGGELAPATEPPVREPAREVELLRSGVERALIATTRRSCCGAGVAAQRACAAVPLPA
jgi:hypothetical protein